MVANAFVLNNNVDCVAEGISDREFLDIKNLIYKIAGISLSSSKKSLVTGRLNKRLKILGMTCFDEYYRFLVSRGPGSEIELQVFIDLLTTNETYFFREQTHFDFIGNLISGHSLGRKPLSIWSAASSSGEEGYSLCMLLADKLGLGEKWRVFGTDISSAILESARQGIYSEQRTRLVPSHYRHQYFLKGTGCREGSVAVAPEIKEHIRFEMLNLVSGPLGDELFDIILCRNVLIYFDLETKKSVVNRLCKKLKPGGYFISGRSESLHSISSGLKTVMPSVYQSKLDK